ncbi:MAG TPA: bifunctional diguanylate cyclase/phosphodiesterase [Methyloceanibacter sp.]|nr:bifunctional diguanylate cyclase/phosphodiesterase [Methyloceanibacter sp.]
MVASSNEFAGGGRVPPSQTGASIVDFGQRGGEPPTQEPLDLDQVLESVRATAYRWDFANDTIDWAENAGNVLGVDDIAKLRRGRAFALHIDPEHAGRRYDGVTGGAHAAPGAALHYCLHYRFLPEGRRGKTALWVEDTGVCFTDADGRPMQAQGTLRVTADRRQQERPQSAGTHDELTGQLNRTRLTEALTTLLSNASRSPINGAFLLAGVNDLTLVNETYGFDVGDELIAVVGRRLGRVLRGKDCIGRFCSNKFGIVLHDCDADGVEAIARRLMAVIGESVVDTSVGAVAATISVGAVVIPEHASSAQKAIGRALQALDVGRTNRGDQFSRYVPSERVESDRRRNVAIADEIIRALNDRRMMIALQPIVTSLSHEPELYECLLRMRRTDGTVMSASEFIGVAEQFGLAKLIDYRVLELAVDLLRASPKIKLALNVSAATATDPHWMAGLEGFTAKDRSLTERLTIEITETAAISDVKAAIKFVSTLKELGCRVALDDFGAGYTSFRSLRQLGVDMVKIDGSFIQNLGNDAEDEMFVRTLIDLARSFGVITVGEWVGDERTMQLLEKAGVSYMQGYFFGKPELAKESGETKTSEPAKPVKPAG